MINVKTLDGIESLNGKVALVRVDLNVPMRNLQVQDTTRIERICPTIHEIVSQSGKCVLISHFGRPKGELTPELSLEPVVDILQKHLKLPVTFVKDCIGDSVSTAVGDMRQGSVILLENTRFHVGEENNDPEFARALTEYADLFVNDAFSASHRAHASTEGVAHLLPSYAGRSMEMELMALSSVLSSPERPVMALVGGAKISSKIELLENLITKVDILTIGGGMANTFLAARGVDIGNSLNEPNLLDTAGRIMDRATGADCEIILPVDAVVATELKEGVTGTQTKLGQIDQSGMILDIGEATIQKIGKKVEESRTLLWNGPLGAFEVRPFDNATVSIAKLASELTKRGRLKTIAGGGDTVSALNHAGVSADFTYVSTAGGAFLEWLEGKKLPGVQILGF